MVEEKEDYEMKILLLGSNGMLGQAIKKTFFIRNIDLICVAKNNADYNIDLLDDAAVESCLKVMKPDVVINSAALVNLSLCEKNKELAYRTNTRFCAILADICQSYGSYLIHISTDHYYTGDLNKKHFEKDKVKLLNEYARTKFLGELLIKRYDNSLVIRTNIVGFKGNVLAPTFLEWVIMCLVNNSKMQLFDDFYTSSMHDTQLAEILIDLIRKRPIGILNIASSEVLSKKDFILLLAKELFSKTPDFTISSVKALKDVKRAESLGLSVGKAESILGYKLPDTGAVIKSIKKEYEERYKK